ncbi:hypothetical protein C2S52_017299 [Perilla frutescens var. hirtella]|nr:hypothetical protein C2S52_017299 [Perilla frutescens var. hirtella]KAH6811085.1 hypothetical protein C2S51_024847 [Perilla frutescens var. frutescens]
MVEKNTKSNGEQQKKEGAAEGKKKLESGGGKGNGNVTVVLKTDFHCEGCVSKILKCIRASEGVDVAKIGDGQITVVGKVDPAKLRERVEKKTHKKVEVVSPQTNKNGDGREKDKGKENGGGGGDNAKQEKKKDCGDKNSGNKSDDKKSKGKEPPVTTAVLKVNLHCEGCIQKIRRIVAKTKGYRDLKVDKQKDIVTVTGALDMKALAEVLKKHLKREVQIVPPKKEAEKKENPGKGGGGDKAKNGGGDKGRNGGEKAAGGEKMEGNNNKMQFQVAHPYPHPHPFTYESGDQFQYNQYPYPYAFGPIHAPQLFSDENPNSCSVM